MEKTSTSTLIVGFGEYWQDCDCKLYSSDTCRLGFVSDFSITPRDSTQIEASVEVTEQINKMWRDIKPRADIFQKSGLFGFFPQGCLLFALLNY